MADDTHKDAFDEEASRLKDGLKMCRDVLANYRSMLNDSSNDNPIDDVSGDDSEVG